MNISDSELLKVCFRPYGQCFLTHSRCPRNFLHRHRLVFEGIKIKEPLPMELREALRRLSSGAREKGLAQPFKQLARWSLKASQ